MRCMQVQANDTFFDFVNVSIDRAHMLYRHARCRLTLYVYIFPLLLA